MLPLSSTPGSPTSHLCCKDTFVLSVYPSTFPPNTPLPHPSSILTPHGTEPWQCLPKHSLQFLPHLQLWTLGSAESSQSGLANQRSVSLQMRWSGAFLSHKLGMGCKTARSSKNRHESTANQWYLSKMPLYSFESLRNHPLSHYLLYHIRAVIGTDQTSTVACPLPDTCSSPLLIPSMNKSLIFAQDFTS